MKKILALVLLTLIFSLTACRPANAVTSTTENAQTNPKQTLSSTPTIDPNMPPPCTAIGQKWVSSVDGMELVCVPAGAFFMGANDEIHYAAPDEKPYHHVTLSAYWIDEYEVSNAQYAKCVKDGACTMPGQTKSVLHSDYYYSVSFQNFPVESINWNQAKAYCEWAKRQLPTEAQWERAARGDNGAYYPWGNADGSCDKVNFKGCGGQDSIAVDNNPKGISPYGAFNMSGNVQEWVNDWEDPTYYQNSLDAVDPQGPYTGSDHIMRGGSFGMTLDHVYAFSKKTATAGFFDFNTGFRCDILSP